VLVGAGLHIENYFLPTAAYRLGLEAAGFTDVVVHKPVVPPEAIAAREPGFWDELIQHPVFALIDCVRA
jgi:hypothetical protein